ncbi:MAG: hypothetical protein AAFP98_05555, partial [Pseudomonadota bacterium]
NLGISVPAVFWRRIDAADLDNIALSMHLMEVAVDGVTEAVLSAANASAAKVYTALGFQRSGDFALVIYDEAQVVDG